LYVDARRAVVAGEAGGVVVVFGAVVMTQVFAPCYEMGCLAQPASFIVGTILILAGGGAWFVNWIAAPDDD